MDAIREERLRVLEMVAQGLITAEEGARLIEALERPTPAVPAPSPASPAESGPRWLRVRVTELASGRTRVNVRLPVSVLEAGARIGARFAPGMGENERAQILRAVRAGTYGPILEVVDAEEGERVEIFLE
ncbi:hypothetical protein SE15_13490 [Thermanaerothrix daxensis]|uniref:YvlB/LiaX N-terminal domain-containing protein n=1 Tax=Thermanaerothrix daxensis TaxID=869279 RepID=A0A0P6XZU3_9CHLR|nr:hypothetical protein [Thermanaerothrix daxensis]KPL82103.1 hypothetical protein SE15_13490 [Thermanaerothrix daxensis]